MQWWKATVVDARGQAGGGWGLVYDAMPELGFDVAEEYNVVFHSRHMLGHLDDNIPGEMQWRMEGEDVDIDGEEE